MQSFATRTRRTLCLLLLFSALGCGAGSGTSFDGLGGGAEGGAPPDDQGGNADEGTTLPGGGPIGVPILIQEILPPGKTGFDRSGAVATFGIPFASSDEVGLVNGRPALAVQNAQAYQFRTLATWPDGFVKWALVDAQTNVAANAINSSLTIINGTGRSSPDDLAFDDGSLITIQTGPLVAQISKNDFNLFHQVWVDGAVIVPQGQSLGIVGTGVDGSVILPKPGTVTVAIEENGPVRAVVRADGTLRTSNGLDILDFTCRIIARAGSRDLQVDFTARNANIARPQHVVLESLNLVVRANAGSGAMATMSRHDGVELQALNSGDAIFLHQAQSAAPTYNTVSVMLGQEGYEIVKNGATIWPLGDKSKYPPHGYADLTGSHGGITLAYRYMPQQSPASIELFGSGDVVAGLFSGRHAPGKMWGFSWRQHESRTVSFSFHQGAAANASLAAKALDLPISGRAADYLHYDRAGVLPYRLVSIAQQNAAFAAMGLNYTVAKHNEEFLLTRWLYGHEGGGSNNHDSIERRLGSEWLRQGFGGQYLTGLDLALYKSEWQILRSDNFHDIDDPGAANPSLPHTTGYEGDYEHRYMDGIILAYYLTGDPRLRDALLDEAEILSHLAFYEQDRSSYQSIRALTRIAEFSGDTNGVLRAKLKSWLNEFCNKILPSTATPYEWGWEAAPDAGSRRFYTSDYTANAPDHYRTRGFVAGSLGPIALYHAARWLGPNDPHGALARGRMRDLAFYGRNELFPYQADPADRRLVYEYGINTQTVHSAENTHFHPLMLGWGEAYGDSGDSSYLEKAVEQFEAFAALDEDSYPNVLHHIETRLDVQHFLRIYLDSLP